MQPQFRAVALAAIALWLTGCSDDYVPRPPPQVGGSVSKPNPPLPPPPPPPLSAFSPPAPSSSKPTGGETKKEAVARSQSPAPSGATGAAAKGQAPARFQPPAPAAAPGGVSKEQSAARPQAPAAKTPAASQPSQASRGDQHSIRLSMGVALPQTGPEGIMMTFSVEYEVVGGPSSAGYVCVVERERGGPAKLVVPLARQGTLPIFIPGWRPEQGPFRLHFEDRRGRRLSPDIELHGI